MEYIVERSQLRFYYKIVYVYHYLILILFITIIITILWQMSLCLFACDSFSASSFLDFLQENYLEYVYICKYNFIIIIIIIIIIISISIIIIL